VLREASIKTRKILAAIIDAGPKARKNPRNLRAGAFSELSGIPQ